LEVKKHDIQISTKARFFTLGELNEETEEVWFVLHGYGQLASRFLKKFEAIDDGRRLIVAPEGLSRFYWKGFSGNVVASWMTKEDRLDDIDNYVSYLDSVYDQVIGDQKIKVRLLGFSQGTATACRWAVRGKSKIDSLIMWAGAFPEDVNYFENVEFFNKLDVKFLIGKQDQLFTKEQINAHRNMISDKGVNFKYIEFEGDHNIYEQPLRDLL
jgi:predicted esterase